MRACNGKLKAIFAGVARTGNKQGNPLKLGAAALHETQLRRRRHQPGQYLPGPRALQGQQPATGHLFYRLLRQVRPEVSNIRGLAVGVDHQEKLLFTPAGDDQVIPDTALFIGKQRVHLLVLSQCLQVYRHQRLQRRGGPGTADAHLAHMGNIKQAGRAAGMLMLRNNAIGKLHRHLVARKGHHFRAHFAVQFIQWCFQHGRSSAAGWLTLPSLPGAAQAGARMAAMRHDTVSLIGMPGAGKSTVGVLLAKLLGMNFVDSDLLIQVRHGATLQTLLEQRGYLELRKLEQEVLLDTPLAGTLLATGGSAVYSEASMQRLRSLGPVVFIDTPLPALKERVDNAPDRGIAAPPDHDFSAIFAERRPLYARYATLVVDGSIQSAEALARRLAAELDGRQV